jgi:hypothetical protein
LAARSPGVFLAEFWAGEAGGVDRKFSLSASEWHRARAVLSTPNTEQPSCNSEFDLDVLYSMFSVRSCYCSRSKKNRRIR